MNAFICGISLIINDMRDRGKQIKYLLINMVHLDVVNTGWHPIVEIGVVNVRLISTPVMGFPSYLSLASLATQSAGLLAVF